MCVRCIHFKEWMQLLTFLFDGTEQVKKCSEYDFSLSPRPTSNKGLLAGREGGWTGSWTLDGQEYWKTLDLRRFIGLDCCHGQPPGEHGGRGPPGRRAVRPPQEENSLTGPSRSSNERNLAHICVRQRLGHVLEAASVKALEGARRVVGTSASEAA